MASRNRERGVHRIYLNRGVGGPGGAPFDDSDDWFEIRASLSLPERAALHDQVWRAVGELRAETEFSMVAYQEQMKVLQLRKALTAWSFAHTEPDADGGERESPWPLPPDDDGKAAALDEIEPALGVWMAVQADLWYGGRRVAPADPPSGDGMSPNSPTVSPASFAASNGRPAGGVGSRP